jgi:hypothetical protein
VFGVVFEVFECVWAFLSVLGPFLSVLGCFECFECFWAFFECLGSFLSVLSVFGRF